MIQYKIKEDGARSSTLYWQVVIEDGQVKLQCSKDCDDWWYVASVTEDGRMELATSIPDDLGLALTKATTIQVFNEGDE